jgi:hypothetical protein
MPRSSLRSVLLICALSTARMCRVSTQITGKPSFGESAVKPLRQRPSFQSNPPEVMGWIHQHRKQIFRLAFHLYFPKLTSGPPWSLMFRAAVLRTVIWARHGETRHIKVTVGDKDSVVIGGRVGGDFVPRYFFVVQRSAQKEEGDPHAVSLPNDSAAMRYAERTIAELKKEKDYCDPVGVVIVRNEKDEVILSAPFLPACA